MGDLATLPTFQPLPTTYSHTDWNAIFQALTIAPGAVTFSKFQAVATAVMLGRATAGSGNVEALTPAQARSVMQLGDMALQNKAAVDITGGSAILDIIRSNHHTQVPELAYTTAGAIGLGLNSKNNARILLSGNATFTLGGIDSGEWLILALKNATAGDITLTWPAFNETGGGLPKRLAAGESTMVLIRAFGTTLADCFASAGPENMPVLSDSKTDTTHTAGGTGLDLVYTAGPSITLKPGTWMLFGECPGRTTDAGDDVWLKFRNSTDGADFGMGQSVETGPDLAIRHALACWAIVTVTADKLVYLKGFRRGATTLDLGNAGAGAPAGSIMALRLHS
jgi:hypothetical protein